MVCRIMRQRWLVILLFLIVMSSLILYDMMTGKLAIWTSSMSTLIMDAKPTMNLVRSRTPGESSEGLLETLTSDFKQKLALPPPSNHTRRIGSYCDSPRSRGNSCNGTCQRLHIDTDVRTRLSQVLSPPHLHIPPDYQKVLQEMAAQVKGNYDIIVATAASDNHFFETHPMIIHLQKHIIPHLKSFKLIFYNLGLTPQRKAEIKKNCQCQVIDFPFQKFPTFVRNLRCFSWKPVIIKAHLNQAKVLVWADSSVRFDKGIEAFMKTINAAKERSFQFGLIHADIASRTVPSTFHFFGEEGCAYIGLGEIAATWGFYFNSLLVDKLVLEPWVACALARHCMCPVPQFSSFNTTKSQEMVKQWKAGNSVYKFGLQHRFDQSALDILLMKLYRERYQDVIITTAPLSVKRGDTSIRFPHPGKV